MQKVSLPLLPADNINTPVHLLAERDIQARYLAAGNNNKRLLLVLDDDPTGIQTVQDVYVFMHWNAQVLIEIFMGHDVAFIQTNSRALPQQQAIEIAAEITKLAIEASQIAGRKFTIISRSDSSLRGHYPAETDAITAELNKAGIPIHAEILCFILPEAGRYTINNIHYIGEGDYLVPVSATEFAKDPVFGYEHADLRLYVQEKSGGKVPASAVQSIPMELLNAGNVTEVLALLNKVDQGSRVVVNAVNYHQIKTLVVALKIAEAEGKNFVCRSAAAFVKAYGFVPPQLLLTAVQLFAGKQITSNSVLTIIGSYTQKTTAQFDCLLQQKNVIPIELPVELLFSQTKHEHMIKTVASACSSAMLNGHPVLYTSRKPLVAQHSGNQHQQMAQTISNVLVEVVRRITHTPKAIITKGGITSADIALHALGITSALVLGQIRASIPVIQTPSTSRFPSIPLIIFPGNTGTVADLQDIVAELSAGEAQGVLGREDAKALRGAKFLIFNF